MTRSHPGSAGGQRGRRRRVRLQQFGVWLTYARARPPPPCFRCLQYSGGVPYPALPQHLNQWHSYAPPPCHPCHCLQYSGGVPYEALDSLGAYASRPSESYYSFLRRLPEEKGVKLQVRRGSMHVVLGAEETGG